MFTETSGSKPSFFSIPGEADLNLLAGTTFPFANVRDRAPTANRLCPVKVASTENGPSVFLIEDDKDSNDQ
jgi:hypothetical protein